MTDSRVILDIPDIDIPDTKENESSETLLTIPTLKELSLRALKKNPNRFLKIDIKKLPGDIADLIKQEQVFVKQAKEEKIKIEAASITTSNYYRKLVGLGAGLFTTGAYLGVGIPFLNRYVDSPETKAIYLACSVLVLFLSSSSNVCLAYPIAVLIAKCKFSLCNDSLISDMEKGVVSNADNRLTPVRRLGG